MSLYIYNSFSHHFKKHKAVFLTALLWLTVSTAPILGASKEMAPLAAQPTLQDYLAYAALHNPGLQASFNHWKAALERIPQVKALPDPKFTYTAFIREVETRVGPQEQKFGLSQTFPWFGTLRLRGDVAVEAANGAHQRFEAEKLRLFFQVKDAYYEYYYLERAIGITIDNLELLKHLESVAQAKARAGAPLLSVIRAQVELGKLEDHRHALTDLRGPIAAKLNAALNRPYDAFLPWPKQAPFRNVKLREEVLFARLRENNPELKSLDFAIAGNEKAVELARKDSYPDFTLGFNYIDTAEALNLSTPNSGKDPVTAIIAVNVPIWRGKYKAAVQEAQLLREAAVNMRKERRNLLDVELRLALYQFRDSERKIDLFRDTLTPEAEQSLNITEETYRAGNVDFLSLIDAQRLLLEFQLASERALVNREQSLAKIEMLTGREIARSR